MIYHSVIIPQRDRADDIRRQLPELTATLESLGQPYEIIVVDDGSSSASLRLLDKLMGQCHALRLLRLDAPSGTSVALSAGIQAARGEVLIATEPGDYYPAAQIPSLLNWLDRADLVVGRRRRFGLSKLKERVARIPRGLLLGLDTHDPECLFWAARREALAEINLQPGMARYLSALVTRRGFRVCEAYVQHGPAMHRMVDVRPNPGDLLAAWWHCRRWQQQNAYELSAGQSAAAAFRVVGVDGDASRIHSGIVAQVETLNTQMPRAKSA